MSLFNEAETIAKAIAPVVGDRIRPLAERIKALEDRLAGDGAYPPQEKGRAERFSTTLMVKTLDRGDGDRWIIGKASTPSTDLMGDQVLPEGAVYRLPLPLLRGHDHNRVVGSVVEARATPSALTVRCRLTKGVRDADEAWALVTDRALCGLSIGFISLADEPLPRGGRRFTSWRWTELSLVAVAAQPEAGVEATIGKSLVARISETRTAPERTTSIDDMVERLYASISGFVDRRTQPILERIKSLEANR